MKTLLLVFLGLTGAGCLALYVLARNAKPIPPIADLLAELPAEERNSLTAICASAGIEAATLRPLGVGSTGDIFRHQVNRTAVWIENGHVRALGLSGQNFKTHLDFAGLAELEILWLENSTAPGWPGISTLLKLRELNMNGSGLDSPPTALPASLQVLLLARSKVTDLSPLRGLQQLREVDLSDNKGLVGIGPLANLPNLESANLAQTSIASLPDEVGPVELDLEGTPILNPPGFSWRGAGDYSFTGTGLGNTTQRMGHTVFPHVDATGTATAVPALRPVSLARGGGTQPPDQVTVEASIATGRARIWLQEGAGWFTGSWFAKGRVKGFGFVRKSGWVFADCKAGDTVKLAGRLAVTGSAEHGDAQFLIEPLEGTRVTGLRYHVYSK